MKKRQLKLKQKESELEQAKWSSDEFYSMKHYREKEWQYWEAWNKLLTTNEFKRKKTTTKFDENRIIHPYLKNRPEYDAYPYGYDDNHLIYNHGN